MPPSPNKLSQFWQELKRRNVVRVVTVYAGVAFVIIELINNITEPLHLPEWTPTLVIVLLAIGFPIVIIFSWLYDIHPEGGMVRTEATDKVKAKDVPKSSYSWKIASYISFVVIVGLIVLNVTPRAKNKKGILEKSIAVLPFKNDSSDDENIYFINGAMESILDNLCKIEDLRVVSRTSIEQYRNNLKPASEISKEMQVNYILEGSGQKLGSRVLLSLQLIDGINDHHLWSKQYDREIQKVEDWIDIQKEVAQLVAKEIKALITPEELQLIEKIPTTSQTAYDYYQRGREEYWSGILNLDYSSLDRAETLFRYALEYDSTYALAYTSLAKVYGNRPYLGSSLVGSRLFEDYLDSVLILANKALSIDDELSEAYALRGWYFEVSGKPDQAILNYEKAIQYNPNDASAYSSLGGFYSDTDLIKGLENYHKAYTLSKGPDLPFLLRAISYLYAKSGFREKAEYYNQEAIAMDHDTLSYLKTLSYIERTFGNFADVKELYLKIHAIDTSKLDIVFRIGDVYLFLEQFETALSWFKKYIEKAESYGNLYPYVLDRIALAYWINGYKEEAKYYSEQYVNYVNQEEELGRIPDPYFQAYGVAAVYAFLGDKGKAFEKLSMADHTKIENLYTVNCVKNDPAFSNYKANPVFQQYVKNVEAKYQAEHERVRRWLEENDML